MNFFHVFLLMIATLAIAEPAMSAPYCAVLPNGGWACVFESRDACLRDPESKGHCVRNNTEAAKGPNSSGGAGFCVVDSSGTRCNYSSLESCHRAAALTNGACTQK